MGKKEFVAITLDLEHKTFVVYIVSLSAISISSTPFDANIDPFHRPQIAGLIAKEAPIKILNQYINFADMFSLDLVFKLFKHIGINDHAIKLVNGQQLVYGPIYSLRLVELKTLKAYIETNLANGFIRPSKLPASAPIFFDRKSNSLLRLCVNYKGLHNLTIKD